MMKVAKKRRTNKEERRRRIPRSSEEYNTLHDTTTNTTVSYTHLDVYKRQHFHKLQSCTTLGLLSSAILYHSASLANLIYHVFLILQEWEAFRVPYS